MKYQNRKRKKKLFWPDILMQRYYENRESKSYISRDSQF